MELVADITSDLREAQHVHTVARIGGGAPGLMVATSRFWSNNLLTGFKAAAVVVLTDRNGGVIATSDPCHGWADGVWTGTHDNTRTWTYQFDPAVAAAAEGIAVLHGFDEDWIRNLNRFVEFARQVAQIVIDLINQMKTAGGDGGTGRPDKTDTGETSWALVGDPWASYARAPAPRTAIATAAPARTQEGVRTTLTVQARDSATGAPVSGTVYIGTAAVGQTGTPFDYTWNRKYRRAGTALVPLPFNAITVQASGYLEARVPFTVTPRAGSVDELR